MAAATTAADRYPRIDAGRLRAPFLFSPGTVGRKRGLRAVRALLFAVATSAGTNRRQEKSHAHRSPSPVAAPATGRKPAARLELRRRGAAARRQLPAHRGGAHA